MTKFNFKTVAATAVTTQTSSGRGRERAQIHKDLQAAMEQLPVGESLPIPVNSQNAPKKVPTGEDVSPNAKSDDGRMTAIRSSMNAAKKAIAEDNPQMQFSRIVMADVEFSKTTDPVTCIVVTRLADLENTILGENAEVETEAA